MQNSTHVPDARLGGSLCPDASGRLYDPRFRELIRSLLPAGSVGVSLQGCEALAALRMASKLMKQRMERHADQHGLSEGRFQLLIRLYQAEGHQLPLGEVADALEVTPRNITGLVDHLERDGLVERVPDPNDRRSILGRLTPAGRSKVEMIGTYLAAQTELVADFKPEELVQLRDLCLRLVAKMAGGRGDAAG